MRDTSLFLMDLDVHGQPDDACWQIAQATWATRFQNPFYPGWKLEPHALQLNDRAMLLLGCDDRTAHEILDQQLRPQQHLDRMLTRSWQFNADLLYLGHELPADCIAPEADQAEARARFAAEITALARRRWPLSRSKDPLAGDESLMSGAELALREYRQIALGCSIAGFTAERPACPTHWRCFDLRSTPEVAGNAICFGKLY